MKRGGGRLMDRDKKRLYEWGTKHNLNTDSRTLFGSFVQAVQMQGARAGSA